MNGSNKRLKAANTFLGKYVSKRKLGKGAFGDVFLVEHEGKEYALKVISRSKIDGKDNEHLADYLEGEVECMKVMQGKYIVQLFEFIKDDDYYYMLLEYCNGGDLLNLQATFKEKVFSLDMAA